MTFTEKLLMAIAIFTAGFLVACILLYFSLLEPDFSWMKSLREWISAFSGWAAAAGAVGIGIPTLAHLKNQTKATLISEEIEETTNLYNSSQIALQLIDTIGRSGFSVKHIESPQEQRKFVRDRYLDAIRDLRNNLPINVRPIELFRDMYWSTAIQVPPKTPIHKYDTTVFNVFFQDIQTTTITYREHLEELKKQRRDLYNT